MINLTICEKKIRWDIVAGVCLLILAFFIMITSKTYDNKNDLDNKNTSHKDTETYTKGNTTDYTEGYDKLAAEDATTESASDSSVEATTQQTVASINFEAEYPFFIRVNRAENFAVVYGMDQDGHHSIPYKAFVCSTGLEEDSTPLGVFEMSDKYRWRLMVDGTYAQYAIRIEGQIMLHSVPYTEATPDSLEYWEYNKLGQPASLGCVRFRTSAIRWIYNNCKEGTKVNIYDQPGEEAPLPLRKIKKIKKSNSNRNWDPTDPDSQNPWNK